jgi:hypothetical protein
VPNNACEIQYGFRRVPSNSKVITRTPRRTCRTTPAKFNTDFKGFLPIEGFITHRVAQRLHTALLTDLLQLKETTECGVRAAVSFPVRSRRPSPNTQHVTCLHTCSSIASTSPFCSLPRSIPASAAHSSAALSGRPHKISAPGVWKAGTARKHRRKALTRLDIEVSATLLLLHPSQERTRAVDGLEYREY